MMMMGMIIIIIIIIIQIPNRQQDVFLYSCLTLQHITDRFMHYNIATQRNSIIIGFHMHYGKALQSPMNRSVPMVKNLFFTTPPCNK